MFPREYITDAVAGSIAFFSSSFLFVSTAASFTLVVVVVLLLSWLPQGLVVVLNTPFEVEHGLSFRAGCPKVFLLFPGVFPPKGSWGGVDVAARASGCRTAI